MQCTHKQNLDTFKCKNVNFVGSDLKTVLLLYINQAI